ncbi:ThuA domain-containing protein [Chryseolinea lacunae]|uniref:ThuA domain-containing protein n=1 Tax=Chryseolinea lacunae TaxID=2801331 RepID=A0ABS1KYB3_9BACT|nr:ThuA domain-containing protein [Chryseolinea lacunae]MBL0743692.1 ThuA domain-containing protein [Chryseolinea lacunae]
MKPLLTRRLFAVFVLLVTTTGLLSVATAFKPKPAFRVLAMLSGHEDHIKMMTAAKPFLKKIADKNNFAIDITADTSVLNDANLNQYQVIVQLQLAPFDMTRAQQDATEKFIRQGKGWVGIHAAGLTGKSFLKPGTHYWQWFEELMGDVVYSPHPAFQKGTVVVEDRSHPVTKNLPEKFDVSDEWYEFDKSPRTNVHVLATADEATYTQTKPMGDHPIIWTNPHYHRAVYIGIGHDASLCSNVNFEKLVSNAIVWASEVR